MDGLETRARHRPILSGRIRRMFIRFRAGVKR